MELQVNTWEPFRAVIEEADKENEKLIIKSANKILSFIMNISFEKNFFDYLINTKKTAALLI